MPTLNLNTSATLKVDGVTPRRQVFVFAGQSNMAGAGKPAILRGSGLSTNPGNPGAAPNYIAAFEIAGAAGKVNEWIGSPATSPDSGLVYDFPTVANSPCLYNENYNQTAGNYDGWGDCVKRAPNPTTGVVSWINGFGPELSFLQRHLAAYPGSPIAAIKVSVGGTSLGANWMPADTGTNAGGPDKDCFAILRQMLGRAAARLDATGSPWRWGGFVWYQGETGAHSGVTAAGDAAYLSDARLFFAAVRGLTRADLPVVVARISDLWGWEGAGTTNANPYLLEVGYPYAALEASYSGGLGKGSTIPTGTRDTYLAGARNRRATQVTLGGDPNCAWFSTDGLPPRGPYWKALNDYWSESIDADLWAYHFSHKGQLANGERAFTAFQGIRN